MRAGLRTIVVAVAATAAVGCAAPDRSTAGPAPTPTPASSLSPHASVTSPGAQASSRPADSHPANSATPTAPHSTSPTTSLPTWLGGTVVTRLPTNRRVIALTFDGGSGAQGAASVLATLKSARAPATFFLTGNFARSFPHVVDAIGAGGFLVGNHTMSHPHLRQLGSAAVRDQILGAERQLDAELGGTRRPWFRFPYGEYDARTLQLVHGLGYGGIGWTVDTRGWQGKQAGGVDDIIARVRAALRPGAIVLMHLGANPDDGTTYDADALPRIIAMVRAAGYDLVDLRG